MPQELPKPQSHILQVTCLMKNFHWGECKQLLHAIKMLLIAYSLRDISGTFSSISHFSSSQWASDLGVCVQWLRGARSVCRHLLPLPPTLFKGQALPFGGGRWGGEKRKQKGLFIYLVVAIIPSPFPLITVSLASADWWIWGRCSKAVFLWGTSLGNSLIHYSLAS